MRKNFEWVLDDADDRVLETETESGNNFGRCAGSWENN